MSDPVEAFAAAVRAAQENGVENIRAAVYKSLRKQHSAQLTLPLESGKHESTGKAQ